MEDLPTKIETRKRTCSTEGSEIWYSAFLKVAQYSYNCVPILRLSNLGVDVVTKDLCLGLVTMPILKLSNLSDFGAAQTSQVRSFFSYSFDYILSDC